MATTLKQVLTIFETHKGPLSLAQMARELEVEPGILEGMLAHWVRKGRLREVTPLECTACGSVDSCPFIMKMPRGYELVAGDDVPPPPCNCCG